MSLTSIKSELDLASMVEQEVRDYAGNNGSIDAATVVTCFKNVAIDYQGTVAQLPINLWQVFHLFEQRPPTTVIGIEEVIKKLKAA